MSLSSFSRPALTRHIPSSIADCINIVKEQHVGNIDTKPFLLGLYFGGWKMMESLEKGLEKEKKKIYEYDISKGWAIHFFKNFRAIQKQIGIDDETLCRVNHLNYDVVKVELDKWTEKVKTD